MTYRKKINLSSAQLNQIIAAYQAGLSAQKVGQQFGYSGEFIQQTLRKNGITLRKYHEINRKHQVKEDFFDVINEEEKAYFLGLLYSDGNIHTKYNAIVLKLQKRDKEILSKLSHLILGKEKLLVSENNYVLQFSSQHIKQRLIEIGCHPNKTFTLIFPDLPSNMIQHFIRGYFDGDGSIYSYDKDTEYAASFISTERFCQSLQTIISNELNLTTKLTHDKSMVARGNIITSIILYRGNRRVLKLMDWIYKDATIYLDRKYQKYLNLKQRIEEVDQRISHYKSAS